MQTEVAVYLNLLNFLACPTGWRSAFNLEYCIVKNSGNWYQSKVRQYLYHCPIHIDRYRAWHYIITENNRVYMYTSELNYSIYHILGSSMMVFYDGHFGQGYSAKLIFRHLRFSKQGGWQSVFLRTQ